MCVCVWAIFICYKILCKLYNCVVDQPILTFLGVVNWRMTNCFEQLRAVGQDIRRPAVFWVRVTVRSLRYFGLGRLTCMMGLLRIWLVYCLAPEVPILKGILTRSKNFCTCALRFVPGSSYKKALCFVLTCSEPDNYQIPKGTETRAW